MTKSMKRLLTPRPLWRMAGCRLGCASPSSHCSVNSIVSNPALRACWAFAPNVACIYPSGLGWGGRGSHN